MKKSRGVRREASDQPVSGSGDWLAGVVISHLGHALAVESDAGEIVLCHTRRRLGHAAVGDRVLWEALDDQQGRVMEILPRRNLLTRPGHQEKNRLVAANLDQIAVILAPLPEPDWLLVDQFLIAAECRGYAALLVINKMDLPLSASSLEQALSAYQAHYPCFRISVKDGMGMAELKATLLDRCTLLAGQSGVGKSSLSNALLPDRQLRVGEISERSGLGRHTTTTATLHHLPGGGDVIDSPGVNVFGLADLDEADLGQAYLEFRPFIEKCQFNDCRHLADKDCAVREAIDAGLISRPRYQRYVELLGRLRRG